MATKIKCFAISCSSDGDMDARNLYVWGGEGTASWLPDSIKGVKQRLERCRQKYGCSPCDAEVHEITILRTRSTKCQIISTASKPHKESTP